MRYHTLIWRPGDSVQNLEYPGLSGRVYSTGFCPEKPKSIAEQASEVILTAELTIMQLKLTAWSPNPKGCESLPYRAGLGWLAATVNQSTNLFNYASHKQQKLISSWGVGKDTVTTKTGRLT